MKMTPWFSGNVKPVRVGVYQRLGDSVYWSFWNGEFWGTLRLKVAHVDTEAPWPSTYPDLKWRGLAEEPKP